MRFVEPGQARQGASGYGIAALCMVVAIVARILLDPFLGESRPFVTVFGGVAVAVWFARWRAATLAAVLGYAAAQYLIVFPRLEFHPGLMLEDFRGFAFRPSPSLPSARRCTGTTGRTANSPSVRNSSNAWRKRRGCST
jgi:hypothetical protein